MNAGLEAANGKLYGILDEDNAFAPGHVRTLREGLERCGADAVYTGARVQTFSRQGELVEEHPEQFSYDYDRLLLGNFIRCSTMCIRKAAWADIGGYDSRFPVYEDWEFLVRLGARHRIEAIGGFSSFSRSYTGLPGVPEHHREGKDCSRCAVGLFWVHRKKYDRAFFQRNAQRWKEEYPQVPRWGVRRQTLPLLASWWWRYGRTR
jgi:hypothetical protein